MDATGSAVPAQPAPARCAPACAAATVLLGIPGLLVTAVAATEDGQTLVEVITDPAVEAARCCPRCGKAATRIRNGPGPLPATCSSATGASSWPGADPVALRDPRL